MTILNNIPIELDSRQILNKLGLEADDKFVDLRKIIQKELEHALSVANPKALYHTAFVNRVADNSVFINGVQFTSNVLRINLEDKTKVFPYIVTVGEELDRLTPTSNHLLRDFLLDTIKNLVLKYALNYLTDHILESFKLEQVSSMNPGSLKNWPLNQQKQLFTLLGEDTQKLGVKLNEDFRLNPAKSLSGIFFPTTVKFENCQLCPRERCNDRRAHINLHLMKEYGIKSN